MGSLYTLIGAALIVAALRDIFQEMFNPSAYGRLSHSVKRTLWRVFRRAAARKRRMFVLAGPLSLVSIVLLWVLLLAIGWALVIWPHLPQGFLLSTGLSPRDNGGFVDAIYVSTVTLVTLGYGDIVPTGEWFRVLLTLEALTGMAVLTASVTWVLSIYPVLSRRRSLARTISLIGRSAAEAGEFGEDQEDAQTLESLASQLVTVEEDLEQFPVTYYFYEENERTALSAVMPELLHLAEKGADAGEPALRRRAAMLQKAVEDFSSILVAQRFAGLSSAPVEEVLEAYARDHWYAPTKTAAAEEVNRRDP